MKPGATLPWTRSSEGVVLRVRVTPKSSKDVVEGLEATPQGPALKVRVRAVPDKGAANAAVAETVARWLGVPKSSVVLVSGSTARVKGLAIAGDADALSANLERRIGEHA
ncbi:DUF167 family protein [Hyphomicrobium sp. CS1BSMeth3]|uniref:DUF167 family protein n=1 Tax=Hyphomicrobium sp. CS1BSMeth3 TaxID=1892844 RepID=UPI000931688D|nr:DUF167 family protein [Hyphomicrobium sp. CS1BSMeth3]